MNFALSRRVHGDIDAVEAAITTALKDVGFGILTRIEVDKTLKEKLGVDVAPYRILGACNPQIAYQALQVKPEVGVFLPCSVCLRQEDNHRVSIWALDPQSVVDSLESAELSPYGAHARELVEQALNSLPQA